MPVRSHVSPVEQRDGVWCGVIHTRLALVLILRHAHGAGLRSRIAR